MEKIGRYQVIEELGKGATAVVYLARDPSSANREVAIKLVKFGQGNQALSRRLKKLFQTEFDIGQRLDHPNIVHIYDAAIEKDFAYIVMEYIKGLPLDHFCAIDKLLPLHRAIGIVFKCCLALDYAYRQGVIHRDIKPANILIDDSDNPKITDFGLSLNLMKPTGTESTFIMGVGSPAYMSPEQIKAYPLNQMTDIYSLGTVLFQLLTGRLPFRATNVGALVYKIINMEPPNASSLNPRLPPALDKIIRKALEKDLFNRYKNGAEFAKDLSSVRFQMVDDSDKAKDTKRFDELRKLKFFAEFEDIDLWEILRISKWVDYQAETTLFEEGSKSSQDFGILLSGEVELSIEGLSLARLGPGEIIGEMAYLGSKNTARTTTVTALQPVRFLYINSAALALSSEEVLERMNKGLIGQILSRLDEANKKLAKYGKPAVGAKRSGNPDDWKLV